MPLEADRPSPTAARRRGRRYQPQFTPPVRRAAADYLRAKGCTLRPAYAALCIAQFLHDDVAREGVCAADIRALFPRSTEGIAGQLRNPSDILRRAAVRELVAPLGDGWYCLTSLGRAVVEALPDDEQVAALRGCRTTSCGVGRRQWELDGA